MIQGIYDTRDICVKNRLTKDHPRWAKDQADRRISGELLANLLCAKFCQLIFTQQPHDIGPVL